VESSALTLVTLVTLRYCGVGSVTAWPWGTYSASLRMHMNMHMHMCMCMCMSVHVCNMNTAMNMTHDKCMHTLTHMHTH